jgi:hypothetical protein
MRSRSGSRKKLVILRREVADGLSKGQRAVLSVEFAERIGLRLSQKDLGALVGVSQAYTGAAKRLPKACRKGVIKGVRPLVWPVPKKLPPPVAPVVIEPPVRPSTPVAVPPTVVVIPPKPNGHNTAISDRLIDAVLRRAGPARVREHMAALSMT